MKLKGRDGQYHDFSFYKAHSRINHSFDKGADKGFTLLENSRHFKTRRIGGYDRMHDSEAKILEQISRKLNHNSQIEGVVNLYTERYPCYSCVDVIMQFAQKYPKIKINVFSSK